MGCCRAHKNVQAYGPHLHVQVYLLNNGITILMMLPLDHYCIMNQFGDLWRSYQRSQVNTHYTSFKYLIAKLEEGQENS